MSSNRGSTRRATRRPVSCTTAARRRGIGRAQKFPDATFLLEDGVIQYLIRHQPLQAGHRRSIIDGQDPRRTPRVATVEPGQGCSRNRCFHLLIKGADAALARRASSGTGGAGYLKSAGSGRDVGAAVEAASAGSCGGMVGPSAGPASTNRDPLAFPRRLSAALQPRAAALVPANKKKDPRYTGIYRDMPGYSGMRPRRLRPMIVGVPLEPGVGGMVRRVRYRC